MGGPLSWRDRLYLDWFYRRKLRAFKEPAQRVGWISPQSQAARFEQLLAVGDLGGCRVLDVGCGLGGLLGFLRSRGWSGTYTGFDRMREMVEEARRLHLGARFEVRDISENPPGEAWDYVFLSGLFNHRIRDNWAWIAQGVGAALPLAERGLAFNLLGDGRSDQDPDFFYASRDDLEGFAEGLAPGRWRISVCPITKDWTAYLYPRA